MRIGVLVGAMCCCVVASVAVGGGSSDGVKHAPIESRFDVAGETSRGHVHGAWCVHRAVGDIEARFARERDRARGGVVEFEDEPNDLPGSGQFLALGTSAGGAEWIDVFGEIEAPGDEDEYRFHLRSGDIFGVAINRQDGSELDSFVSLLDGTGLLIHANDDGVGIFTMPPITPLPLIQTTLLESMVQFVAPIDGEYRVRVRSWENEKGVPQTAGAYVASFGVFRHDLENEVPAKKQIIFVDFDGETIDAPALFGAGNNPAVLSPMRSFLGAWGLPGAFETAVIDAVMEVLDARFAAVSGMNPSFDYELRNSRDHADPFGQENVSRLIVGGTIEESGIETIGIAEWIDPGNFSREDTAIILLDVLSDPGFSIAVQNLPRAQGFTMVDAVGRVVGNICAHEAGHYLGCWHTENNNQIPNIMDQGGGNSFIISIPGLGDDGIIGTADDNPTEFVPDVFEGAEGVGIGAELADQRVATALTTFLGDPCEGDANRDGSVDVNDISYVLFRLGGSGDSGAVDGDTNGDGTVDVNDISFVLFRLGLC